MKTKILYIFKNVESHKFEKIDFIEIQKLKRLYASGKKCGKVNKKYII